MLLKKNGLPRLQRIRDKNSGIVLLEALVTIVVLAFGLISIAGLQIVSLQQQKRSRSVEIASEAVLNITERARINPAGVRAGAYRYEDTYKTISSAARTIDSCASSGTCTPTQAAANDITSWLDTVRNLLPGGAASLAPSGSGFVATIMWLDKDGKDESTASSTALVTTATCTASLTSTEWRNCCPASAAAPAGVKCLRNYFLP